MIQKVPVRIAYLGLIDAVGSWLDAGWKDQVPTSVDVVSNDYQDRGFLHGEAVEVDPEHTQELHDTNWTRETASTPFDPSTNGQPVNHGNIDNDIRVQTRILANLRRFDRPRR